MLNYLKNSSLKSVVFYIRFITKNADSDVFCFSIIPSFSF